MTLTDKTISCPDGKEVCLILVRDMTQLLFALLPGKDRDSKKVSGRRHSCSGCTGLIKFVQIERDDRKAYAPGAVAARLKDVMQEIHGREIECPFLQSIPPGKVSSVLDKFQQLAVQEGTILVNQGEPITIYT